MKSVPKAYRWKVGDEFGWYGEIHRITSIFVVNGDTLVYYRTDDGVEDWIPLFTLESVVLLKNEKERMRFLLEQ